MKALQNAWDKMSDIGQIIFLMFGFFVLAQFVPQTPSMRLNTTIFVCSLGLLMGLQVFAKRICNKIDEKARELRKHYE